ncbi:MAG: NADH:flavin oxidoreductase, partial [Gammaproteobacteria bacterium]|nr:NADH:flavin oxidoreductase [Gammaproteobacteria bacterium]MBU1832572.1 NADH:flavin oxidoreductase [Gammaproteobacteria bacterium]
IDIQFGLDSGLDFVLMGRAAMLHHNYPALLKGNSEFIPNRIPVSRDYLLGEGLSNAFIDYVGGQWPDFIKV